MKLVKSILEKNPCYTAGRKIEVKGLMLHSVGCAQPKASVFINSWNKESYNRACVHAFIDGNDGTVFQTLPWNHRGWHGGGESNNTHIGVEMCEPSCIKYISNFGFIVQDGKDAEARAVADRTYTAAVELFAFLCNEYGLDPLEDGVIISHTEGHKRGIASNHGDPEHFWKGLNTGYTMNGFREDVKKALEVYSNESDEATPEKLTDGYYRVRKSWDDKKSQLGAYKVLANAKAKADENAGYFVYSEAGQVVYPAYDNRTEPEPLFERYRVRVNITTLNIRKGAGTNYGKVGQYTGKGVFTIVDEAFGEGASKWGLLKAYEKGRNGWISLDYATKIE